MEYSIGEVFDGWMSAYNQKMIGWVPFYEEALQSIIPKIKNEIRPPKCVDLGCGNGNVTARILDIYPQASITLVDASNLMIEACKTRFLTESTLQFKEMLMQDLFIDEHSTDLVCACYSLHHLDQNGKNKIIKRIHRWLKPGGFFSYVDLFVGREDRAYTSLLSYWQNFVTRNTGDEGWTELIEHHRQYDHPESLAHTVTQLQEAGFKRMKINLKDKYWGEIIATA